MSPSFTNPLQDTHCQCLNGICTQCEETQRIIDAAQAAGWDVSQAREINQRQLAAARATRQQFFPNG